MNRKRGLSKISNSPKFSYKIDARTHKIILCYTISVPDATKKKGYKRVHKQKYHKHLTLEDYKLGLDVLEDENPYDNSERAVTANELGLGYWDDNGGSIYYKYFHSVVSFPSCQYNV